MNLRTTTVSIKQLPETINMRQRRSFLRELKSCLDVDRPHIVIDCSRVREIDRGALFLLLCCLEEAMKRQGDVRLATVPQHAEPVLSRSGIGRLFRIFDHVTDAVNSYHGANVVVLKSAHTDTQQQTAQAA